MATLLHWRQSPINEEQIREKIGPTCPPLYISMMKRCCSVDPQARPTFANLLDESSDDFNANFQYNIKTDLHQLRKFIQSCEIVVDDGLEKNSPPVVVIIPLPTKLEAVETFRVDMMLMLTEEVPLSAVKWYKDGKEIQSSEDIKTDKEGTCYQLQVRSCTFADEGIYRCFIYKEDCGSTELKVVGKRYQRTRPNDLRLEHSLSFFEDSVDANMPFSHFLRSPLSPEPIVVLEPLPDVQEALEKSDAHLVLVVSRDVPVDVVSWHKDGHKLKQDHRLKIFKQGAIHKVEINNCVLQDAGRYSCFIEGNIFGTTELKIEESLGDSSLMKLAENIGMKWKKMASLLGFTWPQIHAFERDTQSVVHALKEMLFAWREQEGAPLTLKKQLLEDAMEKLEISRTESWDKKSLDDDVFMYELAEHIGNPWKDLGVALGFEKGHLDHISTDHRRNSCDACFEMLQIWRARKGRTEEAFAGLLQGLQTTQQVQLVEQLKNEIRGIPFAEVKRTVKEKHLELSAQIAIRPVINEVLQYLPPEVFDELEFMLDDPDRFPPDDVALILIKHLLQLPHLSWVGTFNDAVSRTTPQVEIVPRQ